MKKDTTEKLNPKIDLSERPSSPASKNTAVKKQISLKINSGGFKQFQAY